MSEVKVKLGDFLFVPTTNFTLEVKDEDFLYDLLMIKGELMVGKYTSLSTANMMVKEGVAQVINK